MKATLVSFLLMVFYVLTYGQLETNMDREFIYEGRQYVPNSPWFTIGFGPGYNFNEKGLEPHFNLDAHFRVYKKHYLAFGFLTSRDQFFDSDTGLFLPFSRNPHGMKSTHLTYGLRIEKLHANYSLFAGPSANWGYDYLYTDSLGRDWSQKFFEPGIYLALQATWKFYFDMGIGTTLWASYSKSYPVFGLSVHWYLSTAFKRQVINL